MRACPPSPDRPVSDHRSRFLQLALNADALRFGQFGGMYVPETLMTPLLDLTKAYDEARAVAKGALPEGPFKGVPFLVKDLGQRVKGWPRTSARSGMAAARVAAAISGKALLERRFDDATLVRWLAG